MTIHELLYDSLFQTIILGPVVPIVLGSLLGLFRGRPISEGTSPVRRIEIIQENRQTSRVEVHHYHHQPTSSDDGLFYVIGAAVLVVVTMWGYVKYLELLVMWSQKGIAWIALMLGAFFLSAFLKQGYSVRWFVDACFVGLLLGLCYWLTSIPLDTIGPAFREIAARSNAWVFFNSLSQIQRDFILFQFVGMVATVVTTIFASLRGLHLLMAAMANTNGQGALASFALATAMFGRKAGGAFMLFTALVAWLLVAETRYQNGLFWQLKGLL